MAHVGLLYPSHESGGGKHNPNPSSFSRAEFLRQQRNPAEFPSRKRERRGTMQAVTRGRQGHRRRPAKPGFLPGRREFCREDGISAGPATGTGAIHPGWASGRRRDRQRGLGAAVKQVPREEGQAEGSFVEERRDEGSAGLWSVSVGKAAAQSHARGGGRDGERGNLFVSSSKLEPTFC